MKATIDDLAPPGSAPAIPGRVVGPGRGYTAVAVVSPYPSVRAGLRVLLESEPDQRVTEEASSLQLLRTTTSGREPDVVVLDAAPGRDLEEIDGDDLGSASLILLGAPDTTLQQVTALLPRPFGILRRDAEAPELIAAVRAVNAGLVVLDPAAAPALLTTATLRSAPEAGEPMEDLTPREHEVLVLLVEGIPNKAIARRLGISDHTVKFHVGSVLSKLGAASRTEAVRLAARRGLVAL